MVTQMKDSPAKQPCQARTVALNNQASCNQTSHRWWICQWVEGTCCCLCCVSQVSETVRVLRRRKTPVGRGGSCAASRHGCCWLKILSPCPVAEANIVTVLQRKTEERIQQGGRRAFRLDLVNLGRKRRENIGFRKSSLSSKRIKLGMNLLFTLIYLYGNSLS